MKRLIYLVCFTLSISSLMAQSECHMFHRKSCVDKEKLPMRYDSQSKSAVMSQGQTSEFHLVAYSGLDYRVSVCSSEMLGDKVHLKIYEKHRVRLNQNEIEGTNGETYADAYSDYPKTKQDPKYKLEKELVYDNSTDNYNSSIEFTAESTMSLLISIEVPGAEQATSSKSKLKIKETACVGVLVEHAKTSRSGF